MTAWATCSGEPIVRARVHVPSMGPWMAELDFEDAPDVSGRVTTVLGELELVGTVRASSSGTHVGERRLRVVAGADGWGTLLPARAYHNDNGVSARTVAEDAAREAGETLDASFAPSAPTLGVDYVRQAGPASRVLEEAIGDASWWVAYDGTTHVGTRSSADVDAEACEVLDFDPRNRIATVAADDLRTVGIGSVLSERLDAPQTVRELDIVASADEIRIFAWCGSAARRSRAADALERVVDRLTDGQLFGLWRYRVVRMSGNESGTRVELQAVRREAGLPDILPISMWPGIGGSHTEPTPGALVLVQFIEGRRSAPVVTHFEGKDGAGWTPANLTFDATTLIKVGADATDAAGRAPPIDGQLDDINQALDAFAAAVPVPNDGGAFIQAAFKAIWGTGVPPKPPSDVGATKVRVE